MVLALQVQIKNGDFVKPALPVGWISLLFGIQRPPMGYSATMHLVSKSNRDKTNRVRKHDYVSAPTVCMQDTGKYLSLITNFEIMGSFNPIKAEFSLSAI
jgi:hypothetical protein